MLRIASYNIENLDFNPDDSNPQLEKRIPFLRATLNRLQADILCLQELKVRDEDFPEEAIAAATSCPRLSAHHTRAQARAARATTARTGEIFAVILLPSSRRDWPRLTRERGPSAPTLRLHRLLA